MSSAAMAIIAIPVLLAVCIGLLGSYQRRYQPHPELMRKLVHVLMGLATLPFPWVFSSPWPVVGVASVAFVGMLGLRFLPSLRAGVGGVLHAVQRQSAGELFYPVAVALVFWLSRGDPLLFVIPMLVLSLADAVAALIGISYGRLRYASTDGVKSAEGSAAFFCAAFFSVHVPLLLCTQIGRAETLLISLVLGLFVMMVEAVSWRGLDNLFIPVFTYALLRKFESLSVGQLSARLFVLLGLLILVVSLRARSALNAAALLAAILFAYSSWALADLLWIVAPFQFFVIHAIVWPASAERRTHDFWTIVAVVFPAIFWLVLWVETRRPELVIAYSSIFATHLAVVGVSWIDPALNLSKRLQRITGWSLIAWAVVFIPTIVLGCVLPSRLITPVGVLVPTLNMALFLGAALPGIVLASHLFGVLDRAPRKTTSESVLTHWQGEAAALFSPKTSVIY